MVDTTKGWTRRRWLGAAGVTSATALAGLETLSLQGAFDHWRHWETDDPSRRQRLAASLEDLANLPTDAGAFLHVGHSTHLLLLDGQRFLTDPWFYNPAFGAMELDPGPAGPPTALGPIDAILISHDHPDHADIVALDQLPKNAVVMVHGAELAKRIRGLGFSAVNHVVAGDRLFVGSVSVSVVPAEHDISEVGFVLQTRTRTVYFAGDTRLFEGLKGIAEQFPITTAILPVDGTRIEGEPLWTMRPADALEATHILGPRQVFPSHAQGTIFDPIGRFFTHHVANAEQRFSERVSASLKGTSCELLAVGAWAGLDARKDS